MQYSLSTLKKKANNAGYSFQKGYQRYLNPSWGYFRTVKGERIVGYQIFDYRLNGLVWPSYDTISDHAMDYDTAVSLLKELCDARGVSF